VRWGRESKGRYYSGMGQGKTSIPLPHKISERLNL
jgi:hypothetical protein